MRVRGRCSSAHATLHSFSSGLIVHVEYTSLPPGCQQPPPKSNGESSLPSCLLSKRRSHAHVSRLISHEEKRRKCIPQRNWKRSKLAAGSGRAAGNHHMHIGSRKHH
eukprot:592003-Rhodomonas_salina.1